MCQIQFFARRLTRPGTSPLTVLLLVLFLAGFARAAKGPQHQLHAELAELREGMVLDGFHASALYKDDTGQTFAARFTREKTGMSFYLVPMETVPRVALWFQTLSVSDRGEAHTLEHLLLGKGKKGRALALLEQMRLAQGQAETHPDFTFYHFYTDAGEDAFFELLAQNLESILHPDFTQDEARRETFHYGVESAAGKPKLVEKGTVYDEMTADEGHYQYYYDLLKRILGADHPLARVSGGLPAAMRQLTPEQIRAFHAANYRLSPQAGMMVALAPQSGLRRTLARLSATLAPFESAAAAAPPIPPPSPLAVPAGDNGIRMTTFPGPNADDIGKVMFAWPILPPSRPPEDRLALQYFTTVFSHYVLRRGLIDRKTREIETAVTDAGIYVDTTGGFEYIGGYLEGIPSPKLTQVELERIRSFIARKLQVVHDWKADSPELLEFNRQVSAALDATKRHSATILGNPPPFGFRNSGAEWKEWFEEVDRVPGFSKSMTSQPQRDWLRTQVGSGKNFWARLLGDSGILTLPLVSAAVASPTQREELRAQKQQRQAAALAAMKQRFVVDSDEAALFRLRQQEEASEAQLAGDHGLLQKPRFVAHPPLTYDDGVQYRVGRIGGGVPLTTVHFAAARKLDAGINFDLRQVPRQLYVYLPLLPALLKSVGLKEGDKITDYLALSESLSRDVLGLGVDVLDNPYTDRYELRFWVQALSAAELTTALGYIRRMITSSYLAPENSSRLTDLLESAVSAEDSLLRSAEEEWLGPAAAAFRHQDKPLYMALASSFTRMNNLHRIRWRLRPALTPEAAVQLRAQAEALLNEAGPKASAAAAATGEPLASASAIKACEALQARLVAKGPRSKDLQELLEFLGSRMKYLPADGCVPELRRLLVQVLEDHQQGPEKTLADMRALRDLVINTSRARAYLVGNPGEAQVATAVLDGFISRLPASAAAQVPRQAIAPTATAAVISRMRARYPDLSFRFPLYVGLVNPKGETASVAVGATGPGFRNLDRASLLELLGAHLLGGSGPHGLFQKTWNAGLAYNNGITSDFEDGRVEYRAERCPSVSATLDYVDALAKQVSTLDDPWLVDYVYSTIFRFSRAAQGFTSRGLSLADNLADGVLPEQVRKFSQALLALRADGELFARIKEKASHSLAKVLNPAGDEEIKSQSRSIFFFAGPSEQLDQVRNTVPGRSLYMLAPSDFWVD